MDLYIQFQCKFLFFRSPEPEMTPEERDARTVFVMQLSARIRPRDLEEFFSAVGKVMEQTPTSAWCIHLWYQCVH